MRLTPEQQQTIREVVLALAGQNSRIVLFGSRLDDAGRGGDIDLMIEADRVLGLLDRARIKLRLEGHLGIPVDVLICTRGEPLSAFQRIARDTGIVLHGDAHDFADHNASHPRQRKRYLASRLFSAYCPALGLEFEQVIRRTGEAFQMRRVVRDQLETLVHHQMEGVAIRKLAPEVPEVEAVEHGGA